MIVGSAVMLVAVGVLWLVGRGLHVETTPAAFAQRAGATVFEERQTAMRLLVPVAGAGAPAEAAWIRRAASSGLAVDVTLRAGGRSLSFAVSGVSPEGDLVVPCSTKPGCAELLQALGFTLPPALGGAN